MQIDEYTEAVEAVVNGLSEDPMVLPSRYFYDRRGSHLFDQICRTEEYYLTRTELEILGRHAGEMAALIGPGVSLIEFGSGSSEKTRILLHALQDPASYIPVDISSDYLFEAADRLQGEFEALRVVPVVSDYTREFDVPRDTQAERSVVFFPGSSIGNFEPVEIPGLLRTVGQLSGKTGGFLVGVDLVKDPELLNAAYNDKAGITAEFNLNMLRHLNLHEGVHFDTTAFRHYAFYYEAFSRIEMHLIATRQTIVSAADKRFVLEEGDDIRTEVSYKFRLDDFVGEVEESGLRLVKGWMDDRAWFAILYFEN